MSKKRSKPSESLNARQRLFVASYLANGGNGKQAAIAAGYSAHTAESQASDLLRVPKVAARVQKFLDDADVTAAELIREARRIAFADLGKAYDGDGRLLPIHQMPEEIRRAIAGIEVEELWGESDGGRAPVGQVRKLKSWDKLRSIELLMKHKGMLVEKVEVKATGRLEHLIAIAREIQKRKAAGGGK